MRVSAGCELFSCLYVWFPHGGSVVAAASLCVVVSCVSAVFVPMEKSVFVVCCLRCECSMAVGV